MPVPSQFCHNMLMSWGVSWTNARMRWTAAAVSFFWTWPFCTSISIYRTSRPRNYLYIYSSIHQPILSIYLSSIYIIAISISVYLSIYFIYSIYSTYIYLNLSIYICHICLSRSLSICHWKHWQDRLGAIDGNAAKTLLGYMRIHKLNGLCMSKKLL